MTCCSCHDVHGSSNYRLLKDVVNGVEVGGYEPSGPGEFVPDPFVISNEPGYPAEGWLLHDDGAAQIAEYQPDYTTPMYAKAPGEDPTRGISAWCAACHTEYRAPTSTPRAGTTPGTASATSCATVTGSTPLSVSTSVLDRCASRL